jgi:hypothetical protein
LCGAFAILANPSSSAKVLYSNTAKPATRNNSDAGAITYNLRPNVGVEFKGVRWS